MVVIGLTLAIIFVFRPIISQFNNTLKIGRSAVLLFPPEVINGVPHVKALVKALANHGTK